MVRLDMHSLRSTALSVHYYIPYQCSYKYSCVHESSSEIYGNRQAFTFYFLHVVGQLQWKPPDKVLTESLFTLRWTPSHKTSS